MRDNINKVSERGERLDSLQDKTDNLATSAQGFRRGANRVRKQIRIRPGFTPQEDVRRFRGTRQAQMDVNTLPKGHIIGWTPPSSTTTILPSKPPSTATTKSAKKNEKRKEKRKEKAAEKVKDSWEDEDEEEAPAKEKEKKQAAPPGDGAKTTGEGKDSGADALADKLEKLDVQ